MPLEPAAHDGIFAVVAQVRTDALPWIHQRCCPRCGYAGWELQQRGESAPYDCPNCDEDLYARRALSYAEREGIVPCTDALPTVAIPQSSRPHIIIRVLRGLRSLGRRAFNL
jgi:hypothetical protein